MRENVQVSWVRTRRKQRPTYTDTDATPTAYEYNPNYQLTKVTKPNADTIEFAYDGDNRRIEKTVNGAITKYIYAGALLAQEQDASGTVLATYTYDDKGSPVKVIKDGSAYYFHYNGKGDVVALTDSTGTVAATFKYDDWGNLVSKAGNIDIPFGYRGRFGYTYDKETGLYFLKSRYYDPETGRFTSKDRFRGFEDRPASQNPYTYCEGDPVNRVDPDGAGDWKTTTLMVLGGVGFAAAVVVMLPEEVVGGTVIGVAVIVGRLATIGSAGIDYYSWSTGDESNKKFAGNTFLNITQLLPGPEWKIPQLQLSGFQFGLSVGDYRNAQQKRPEPLDCHKYSFGKKSGRRYNHRHSSSKHRHGSRHRHRR